MSDISDISTAGQMGNHSIGGNDHNTRQTPQEMAAALSQAVDGLDLSGDEDTQVWADHGAVDLSPDETNKNQHHSIKSRSGIEVPSDETPTNTSSRSNASSVRSTQSKGGPFVCEECQKHCASKSGLKSHMRVHN